MKRAFLLVFDSFGIGASDDAEKFGDKDADTFGHIVEGYPNLTVPNLISLGLALAARESTGKTLAGIDYQASIKGAYGYAQENSLGKDTPSGHWEMAGVPVPFAWHVFPPTYPSFPQKLVDDFIREANLPGILGNQHASGTEIIERLGDEHVRTGKPIVYTSADSVFQIAAHEEHFGLERLYEISKIARKLVDEYNIGRVIARPFLGSNGQYYRTGNRHDYAVPPFEPTLLDFLVEKSYDVYAIGKIADIYAHRGITEGIFADGHDALFDATLAKQAKAKDHSLTFTNFVDFDSKYGHRRDIPGYARALEHLDRRLPEFIEKMQPGDIAFITADHGCDPSLPGSDHTREHVPVLVFGPGIKPVNLGKRSSFADIGATIAEYFDIAPLKHGKSFLSEIS